jgi:hypothetical protein
VLLGAHVLDAIGTRRVRKSRKIASRVPIFPQQDLRAGGNTIAFKEACVGSHEGSAL